MRDYSVNVYAPCRCGSGKKYKFCCLQKDRQEKGSRTAKTWDDPLQVLESGNRPVIALDLDEGERLNNEGMRLLGLGRLAEAERSFRAAIAAAPLVPAAHNNLALVTFAQGRIDEAIRIQEAILRRVPIENVFGMGNLVQFYLMAGRSVDAEDIANKTLSLKPADPSAAAKLCEALARLGRHRDILDAVERYTGESDGAIHHFAGIAAANLGLFDRALDYLRRVGKREPHGERAAKYARLLKAGRGPGTIEENWPYFDSHSIMPSDVFEKFVREGDDGEPARARLVKNPVIVDMLVALLNEGRGESQDVSIVELLGSMDHPRAVDMLERIAEGTFGSDDLRFGALRTLVAKGVWDCKVARKMWIRGKWTDIKALQSAVTPEAENAPLPDGLFPLYEAAITEVRRGRWKEGEKIWRELLAKEPSFHPAYHNLAVALIEQGRNAEAEMHLRKAMELDSGYVFAPCTLAILYLRESRVKEARMLLDKVVVPDTVHPEAMVTYCSAQAQVAAVEGDMEKAVAWLDMAAKLDPGSRSIKELRKRLRVPRLIEKALSSLRSKAEQEKLRRRRIVLSKDAPLMECYGIYSNGELVAMARAIGVDLGPSQNERALSVICGALENMDNVRAILRGLQPEETAALNEVAAGGGRMDYEKFTREHGTDADDEFGWNRQPHSLLGRLKCRGLLVEATVERRPSVFIPARISLPRI